MRSKKITIRTFSETINQLCKYYNTTDTSYALRHCVKDCILQQALFTKGKRKMTPAETLKVVTRQKKSIRTNTRISVRLPLQAINFLQTYYNAKSITDTLHCCINDILNHVAENSSLKGTDKVIYMVGQKNPAMQSFLNEVFDSIRNSYPIDGYVEPFCGTANVLLHTEEFDTEFLNDNSNDLINLLRVLQRYPSELKLELLQTPLNIDTFNSLKKQLKQEFSLKSSKSTQISRATAFYFCRYASVYGKGGYFKSNISIAGYFKRLDTIYPLSQRLFDVNIKKRNAIYFSEVLNKNYTNLLIYFDAPYIGSEEHYKINNGNQTIFSAHTKLRNKVEKLRRNNICLLSYRITASQSMKAKGITDASIQSVLDNLYLNQDFYYKLKMIDKKKQQVEILISTVPFCGSHPYNTPLKELEVV